MRDCLVYFVKDGKTMKLTGVADINKELPLYLSALSGYEDLANKEEVTDDELTEHGIHIVLFNKSDNYVILHKMQLSKSYSGMFPRYRQVVEDAYKKEHGADDLKYIYKTPTNVLLKNLDNVDIISV